MATVNKHVKAVIQLRRATEQEWIDFDPILRVGEPALSTDVDKIKVGDGKRHWSEIPYITAEANVTAGNGIIINDNEISLDDLILDCGTSTTVI